MCEQIIGSVCKNKSSEGGVFLIEMEWMLVVVWKLLFGDYIDIIVSDSFFVFGGDFFRVMRFVFVVCVEGIVLLVVDVFWYFVFWDMVVVVKKVEVGSGGVVVDVLFFFLIDKVWFVEVVKIEVSQFCEVDKVDIEDVYFCILF